MRAKSGHELRVRQLLQALVGPTRAETGCINYDLHESPERPGEFMFHESWTSVAALEAHLQTRHITAAFKLAPELLDGLPQITQWKRLP
jgi:quinol monooxygenase YgiN